MTETHDLATRLLATIWEREKVAQMVAEALASFRTPQGWMLQATPVEPGESSITVYGRTVYDPRDELPRCAADRKIVELHTPVRVPPTWATYGLTRHLESAGGVFCKTCCDEDDGTSYAQRVGLEWPCDTIRALAEGYVLIEQRGDRS